MNSRTRKTIIALGGVLIVVVVCVLSVVGILVGAGVTSYRAAMRAGNEAATLQNLKTICAFEVQYFNTHKQTFGTLEQLRADNGLSTKFSGNPAVADGYVFTLTLSRKPDGAPWYKITADPQDYSTGRNHFYFDSDNDGIRVNADHQAGPADPIQDP